jgi:SAM-dependent methyltransferase
MDFARQLRGVRTLLERRGAGYAARFAADVMWPDAAFRFLWGPDAPPLARAFVFAGAVLVSAPAAGVTTDTDVPFLHSSRKQSSSAVAEAVLDATHRSGITGVRYKLLDLDRAVSNGRAFELTPDSRLRFHAGRGVFFAADRDADRVAFNSHFGAALLTEATVRQTLRDLQARVPPGYRDYAPIDFGGGVRVGQVAQTDSGTGRWEFFNRDIVAPIVAGRRVLDLGSNNGSLPLMMARAGAREVVGLEMTPQIADFARFNARVLAWRDIQPYDVRIETGDMRRMLTGEFGRFDVVTAFCSLYYLPEPDMQRVMAMAASMGATMILQANEAITNLPARTADLEQLLGASGFNRVVVHRYPRFARPLLVAHPQAEAIV